MSGPVLVLLCLAGAWLAAELLVRWHLERPLPRDFYGSLPRDAVRAHQERHGVKTARGPGWIHLGWIADPERERYRVERWEGDRFRPVAERRYGSHLAHGAGGHFRVVARSREGAPERILGEATVAPLPGDPPLRRPRIAGPWRPLFRPRRSGDYVNDHTIFRDAAGRFRLLGITGPGRGDFRRERWLAHAVSEEFPPAHEMAEDEPVADFGELAWAPWVLREADGHHLFWSPHVLHQMRSADGVHWTGHRVTLRAPFHRFFRDAVVTRVAEGQWLLHVTARGRYFSRIDAYQSFDLEHWQYIGPALRGALGSERNSPFASMESPCLSRHGGRYYLSITYNNDSFFWPGLLLLARRWPGRASYNDTRVFHSTNPYDFGVYRGRLGRGRQIARLCAHAAKLVEHPETGAWFVTTAGWPWAATLTTGEVAVAPLLWEEVGDSGPPAPAQLG